MQDVLRVGKKEFNSFDEVIKWAWNEYKIDLLEDVFGDDQVEEACAQLNILITQMEDV
jgi:hypothetical protein